MTTTATSPEATISDVLRLAELADYIVPFAIRVVADLGVADQLAAGPRPVTDVAAAVGANAGALYRVLRTLSGKGLFDEVSVGTFALTPMAELLRSDHPRSVRDSFPLIAADVAAWSHFDHTVRTGGNAFEYVHGMSYFDYIDAHPEYRARFDATMRALTRLEVPALVGSYDWGSFRTLVDVGGGTGGLLAGLLAAFPAVRGVLFDQPTVVAGAPAVVRAAGVADRVDVVAGSFFDDIPAGADGYLLKRILYSWSDDDARRILSGIRRAIAPGGRLVILEPVLRPGRRADATAVLDLLNMAVDNGVTRSRADFRELLAGVGFRLVRMIPTAVFPITVAEPVS